MLGAQRGRSISLKSASLIFPSMYIENATMLREILNTSFEYGDMYSI